MARSCPETGDAVARKAMVVTAECVVFGNPKKGWICTRFDSDRLTGVERGNGDHDVDLQIKVALDADVRLTEKSLLPSAIGNALNGSASASKQGESTHSISPRAQGMAHVPETGESVVWAEQNDCYLGVVISSRFGNNVLASATAQRLLLAMTEHFQHRMSSLSKKVKQKAKGRSSRPNFSLSAAAIEYCDETLGLIHLLVPGGVLTRLDSKVCEIIQKQWTMLQSA